MFEIEMTINKVVDDSGFPYIVECSLIDAWNKKHIFIEKTPIVSRLISISENDLPQAGIIRCELIEKYQDEDGRSIATVSTMEPDAVETIDGIQQFDLLEIQVRDYVI